MTDEIKDEIYSKGRFPANLIHDGSDEVVGLFPSSNGAGKSLPKVKVTGYGNKIGQGTYEYKGGDRIPFNSGSGSAARFFYCAKASKSERNKGLEGFEEIQVTGGGGLTAETKEDGTLNTASAGGKYGSIKALKANHHPTVKPVALMRYLVKMVTPVGGTVLDPFNGSGTTGIACKVENFDYIGIEREEEYVKISEARIAAWEPEKEEPQLGMF